MSASAIVGIVLVVIWMLHLILNLRSLGAPAYWTNPTVAWFVSLMEMAWA